MQNGLVSFSWWYPLGHASHDVLLLVAWKRPAAQGAQSVARAYLDSFWNLPGEHLTHAEEGPSRRRKVPGSQQSTLAPRELANMEAEATFA